MLTGQLTEEWQCSLLFYQYLIDINNKIPRKIQV